MMNNIMEHPHMKSERETEVGESYLSSLRDLTVNSKPLINMLTILAEENLEHAAIIVGAVERHIAQVPREVKLPILYLIDSIVKNVRHDYIQLFTERICSIFCNAFRKVDEKIREKMFALRNTWNDVFTQAVLYRLDVEVHGIDPGWPIIASMEPITPLIHVNPIFFNRKQEPNVCDELEAKKRELLELKKRKLELELAATKKQLEKQMAQDSTPQSVTASLPIMQPSVTEVHGAPGPMVVPMVLQPKAAINNRPRFNPVAPGLINAVIRPRDPRLLTRPNSVANNQNVQPMVIDSMNLNATANHQLNNISYMDMQNMEANQMNNMKMEPIKNNRQLTEKDNNSSNRSTSRRGRDEYSSRSSSRSSRSSRTSAKSHRSSTTKSRSSHYDKKGSRSPTRSSSSERKKRGSSSSKSTRRSRSRSRDNSGSDKSPQKNSNSRRQESSPTSNCGNNLSSPNGRTRDAKPLRTYANRNKINSTSVSNEIENELNISPLRKEQINIISEINDSPGSKDVDLRIAPGTHKADIINNQSTIGLNMNRSLLEDLSDMRKRQHNTTEDGHGPLVKKTKTEKLDILFGKEDVDLRTINKPNDSVPPPPLIKNENDAQEKAKKSKTSFDIVRAKLAEVTKACESDSTKSFRFKDTDLRNPAPKYDSDENSQEIADRNIRTVMNQAQEQLQNGQMTKEQYDTIIFNLINEVKRLKEKDVNKHNNKLLVKGKEISLNPIQDLTPISDEEVGFSSSSDTEIAKAIAMKSPMKRIPKLPKPSSEVPESNATEASSIASTATTTTTTTTATAPAPKKNRRTKWSAPNPVPWPPQQAVLTPTGSWNLPAPTPIGIASLVPILDQRTTNNVFLPPANAVRTQPSMPSPWQASFPFPPNVNLNNVATSATNPINSVAGLNLPIIDPTSALNSDRISSQISGVDLKPTSHITIDGKSCELRFYDEVTIAFMGPDEPKEIGFQSGDRVVTVDGKYPIRLAFDEAYRPFTVDGIVHQIRLGSPMRELYIDNQWYECGFGCAPINVPMGSKIRSVQISGPNPQVRIGNLRTDLVLGQIKIFIDAQHVIPVFLDAKVQTFKLNGVLHTIQFADYLLTALIDTEPFVVEYGGLPKPVFMGGKKHFIRFGALPRGIAAGKVYIRNMTRTLLHRDLISPPPIIVADNVPPPVAMIPSTSTLPPFVNTVIPTLAETLPTLPLVGTNNLISKLPKFNEPSVKEKPVVPPAKPQPNIDELLKNLIAAGILSKPAVESETKEAPTKVEDVKPVSLDTPETLKVRQTGIVNTLYAGMQCSSCGLRYPPELSIKYSQHLDWHFRQNRRDRESARKAHSRKFYYNVTDWIQYEEVEDVADREKNFFEAQQGESEMNNDENSRQRDSPIPSCPVGQNDTNPNCAMCHDTFEQFYNEETEEWHLRPAIRIEDKLYHPICYEDYKASLITEESRLESTFNVTDDNAMDIDDVQVKTEKDENVIGDVQNGIIEDLDDDVVLLPAVENVITEIPDDDLQDEAIKEKNNGEVDSSVKADEDAKNDSVDESDVEIQEPNITVMDLDDMDDKEMEPIKFELLPIKIKEEPKYEGYEDDDDGFEDVGISYDSTITDYAKVDMEDSNSHLGISVDSPQPQTSVALKATIDGNVELQDAPQQSIGTNKIKINITKNVITANKLNKIPAILTTTSNNDENSLDCNSQHCGESTSSNFISNKSLSANLADQNSSDLPMDSDSLNVGSVSLSVDLPAVDDVSTVAGQTQSSDIPIIPETNTDTSNLVEAESNAVPDIEFTYKETMAESTFEKLAPIQNGSETSGLCSIM